MKGKLPWKDKFMQTMWMRMARCLIPLVRISERVQERGELLNYKEILEKIDSLDPEISALQADVTENRNSIKKNTANISNQIEATKSIISVGNSKVNLDKYIDETYASFRNGNFDTIIDINNYSLEDNIEYKWEMQLEKNSALEYGTNITMSLGTKNGNDISWAVENILALQKFSSPMLSKVNCIKFTTTETWTNVADTQKIRYINVFKATDGNHYKTFERKPQNSIVNWWENKIGDSLGDSLTGQGFFQTWVQRYFGLAKFYNHGISGTKMSGDANESGDSMWMDSRINALNSDADFITILGGQNDTDVVIGDLTLENHDTNTFAGAFNVIISKLYYKYLSLDNGYYTDIDYSGINKIEKPHNIIIVPCTPFFVPNTTPKLEEKANAIRTLSRLWSFNVADFKAKSQSNMNLKKVYWGTDLTHPLEVFYKERISPILISTLEELKPIDWDNTIYGS